MPPGKDAFCPQPGRERERDRTEYGNEHTKMINCTSLKSSTSLANIGNLLLP